MKTPGAYFGKACCIFFAVPLPMFLYYDDAFRQGAPTQPGRGAWFYLCLSTAAWIFVLLRFFADWVAGNFAVIRDTEYVATHGKILPALVTSFKITTHGRGPEEYEIALSLKNLSGQNIDEVIRVDGSTFPGRRFAAGETVNIKVDEHFDRKPPLVIEGAQAALGKHKLPFFCIYWLLFSLAVVLYFVLSYETESRNREWGFLRFPHPLVVCPLLLAAMQWGFHRVATRKARVLRNSLEMKYQGIRTQARVLQVRQSGVHANKKSELDFALEFQDAAGAWHRTQAKRKAPLPEPESADQETTAIFYRKDNPQCIAFADEIEGCMLGRS